MTIRDWFILLGTSPSYKWRYLHGNDPMPFCISEFERITNELNTLSIEKARLKKALRNYRSSIYDAIAAHADTEH